MCKNRSKIIKKNRSKIIGVIVLYKHDAYTQDNNGFIQIKKKHFY